MFAHHLVLDSFQKVGERRGEVGSIARLTQHHENEGERLRERTGKKRGKKCRGD